MEVVQSKGQRLFLLQAVEQGIRVDGRNLFDHRPILLDRGILRSADSSSRVLLGSTEVIAAVKADVNEVIDAAAEKPKINFAVKIMAQGPNAPLFERDDADKEDVDRSEILLPHASMGAPASTILQAQSACMINQRRIQRDFEDEHKDRENSVAGDLEDTLSLIFNKLSNIDLSQLIISANHVWKVEVRIMVLTFAGNLYEACFLAAKSALATFTGVHPPVSRDSETGKDYITVELSNYVPKEWSFNFSKSPIFGMSYRIGDAILVDPNDYESVMNPVACWVAVEEPKKENIPDDECSITYSQLSGPGSTRFASHREMVVAAVRSARYLNTVLAAYLKKWSTQMLDPHRTVHLVFNK